MDASEEKDIVLQRASPDLLLQLKVSLPKFLRPLEARDVTLSSQPDKVRRWVKESTTKDLINLLEPFQEWPQLLDPELNHLLTLLVDAYVITLSSTPEVYHSYPKHAKSSSIPLPRAICKILYTLCKIRGPKVISRFFNNEPIYIESMLDALQSWSQPLDSGPNGDQEQPKSLYPMQTSMVWEEKYIMLLWLSHLLLTPFDLASIGSDRPDESRQIPLSINLSPGLPCVAVRVLAVGLNNLASAGKEREAAVALLGRLVLRPDMIRYGLLDALINWAIVSAGDNSVYNPTESIYKHIGILSFLVNIITLADAAIVAPFLLPIFRCMQTINVAARPVTQIISSSASARKLVIKSCRSITIKALQLASSPTFHKNSSGLVEEVLEEVVQHFLASLADKDTPVRFAASKALSVITTKLSPLMADEIVGAIISTLEEKVLWVNNESGKFATTTQDLRRSQGRGKPDFSAVNPLEWQGLILTLSHLLFRGLPSAHQLPSVLNALILAIGFEQRSPSGVSSGTSIRDAACFGIWSFARRYTTNELSAVDASKVYTTRPEDCKYSIFQIIANELIVTASLDPSGNIRRGASAALQEMVGRHPDTIIKGISLVQVVDYHAVALRSRALKEVAIHAAKLDSHYWYVITCGLFGWRAVDTPDIDSRRNSAKTIGLLSTMNGLEGAIQTANTIFDSMRGLEKREVESRHGLLLAASAVVQGANTLAPNVNIEKLSSLLSKFWAVFEYGTILDEKDFTSSVLRPALTAEGSCSLISSLALSTHRSIAGRPPHETLETCLQVVNLSLEHAATTVAPCASEAANALLLLIDDNWRSTIVTEWTAKLSTGLSGSRQSTNGILGYMAALGAVFQNCHSQPLLQRNILTSILNYLNGGYEHELKVGALNCLHTGILPALVFTTQIAQAIAVSLQDYTIDQRGDVGSLVRIEASSTVHAAWRHGLLNGSDEHRNVIALLCGLAVEKLDKVRNYAWSCLRDIWQLIDKVPAPTSFPELSETSSIKYYLHMTSLLSVDWVRLPMLQGLVTSAGVGSESIICASRAALVTHLEGSAEDEIIQLWQDFSSIFQRSKHTDRLVVPSLELFGFLLACGIWKSIDPALLNWYKTFVLVQSLHYKSSSINKIHAAVDVYFGLCTIRDARKEVLIKLAGMLLHPFPSIRNKAAEALYLLTNHHRLETVNWSRPQSDLKPKVQQIREYLDSFYD